MQSANVLALQTKPAILLAVRTGADQAAIWQRGEVVGVGRCLDLPPDPVSPVLPAAFGKRVFSGLLALELFCGDVEIIQ